MIIRRARVAAAAFVCLACHRPPSTAPAPVAAESHLPSVPVVRGLLALRVVYPPADAVVDARDSSFLLGTTGAGDAELVINGVRVQVWPNGAWLAWLPLPRDSVLRFHLVARTPRAPAELTSTARRAALFVPPDAPVWIDPTSLWPEGRVWLARDEYLSLAPPAPEGGGVALSLPPGPSHLSPRGGGHGRRGAAPPPRRRDGCPAPAGPAPRGHPRRRPRVRPRHPEPAPRRSPGSLRRLAPGHQDRRARSGPRAASTGRGRTGARGSPGRRHRPRALAAPDRPDGHAAARGRARRLDRSPRCDRRRPRGAAGQLSLVFPFGHPCRGDGPAE